VYACMHNVYVVVHVRMLAYTHARIHGCACMRACVCMHVCVRVCVCMCACMCMPVCVFICVFV